MPDKRTHPTNKSTSTAKYTLALYAGAMIFNMCVNLTGSVLNEIMGDYDIDLNNGGLMTFFQYIGGIAAILILSRFADRFKKPVILMIGLSVAAASLLIIGGYQPFALFMVLYLIFGASLGILDTNNNAALTDLYPDKMNTVLSILHGVCGIGAVMTPIITAIAGTSNWKSIYQGVAVVVAIIVVLQITMYFSDKKAVDRVYDSIDHNESKASSKAFFADRNIWFATFSMLFFGLSQGGLITWIVKYNTDVFPSIGSFGWAMGLSIYWLGATVCRLCMGLIPIFDKWDSRRIIVLGGLLAGVSLCAGVLSGNYYIFMVCVFLYGILNGATIPRIVALMNGWYPKNTGLSSSLSFTALYSGFAIAALTMGILAAAFGMTVMMLLPVIATVLSGVAAIPISKK